MLDFTSHVSQEEELLRAYLNAQIEGLCKLLMNSAGRSAAGKCEQILMAFAQRKGYPVDVEQGKLSYKEPLPSEAYVDLFDEFVTASIELLGLKMVISKAEKIDQGIDADIRHAADRVGMTTTFIKHL